ncbi:antitoxin Xre/MbcA/ParS toxin-binding domain-containing protein [Shivajiella indica]|uniref:Antitoxin Xre/MbcA/ParS toxin-binding domain-containing protein n=1 Tax=Shivajiella indica TaxID=872115 RepID=A0ABW5B753_9BACT
MRSYFDIQDILGKENFSNEVNEPMDYYYVAEKGLPSAVIQNFKSSFSIGLSQIASILSTSEPTLYRRIKENKSLPKQEAIKLLEATDLFLYGEELFGSKEDFFKWMELPNTALGGLRPMQVISYPEGISKVRDLLTRIEYNVYS